MLYEKVLCNKMFPNITDISFDIRKIKNATNKIILKYADNTNLLIGHKQVKQMLRSTGN